MGQAGALIEATPVNADELTLLQTNLSTKLTTLEALNAEIVELTPEGQLSKSQFYHCPTWILSLHKCSLSLPKWA